MVKNSNFFITFKLYPHTDIGARAEEVFELASSAALGAISPKMSVLDCHMINKFRTSNPEMAEIVSYMGELESEEDFIRFFRSWFSLARRASYHRKGIGRFR